MIEGNQSAFSGSDAFGSQQFEDDVSSQIDGVSQTFVTTYAFATDSLVVYWNGVRQRTGIEITIVNARTFQTQFTAPSGTVVVAVYTKL